MASDYGIGHSGLANPESCGHLLAPDRCGNLNCGHHSGHDPHFVDHDKTTYGCLNTNGGGRIPRGMTKDAPHIKIGQRLRALRESFTDLNQQEFAATLNIGSTRYSNWENGVRRISYECAETLADTYGLSLDWIYRGRVDGLSENARKVLSSHLAI